MEERKNKIKIKIMGEREIEKERFKETNVIKFVNR